MTDFQIIPNEMFVSEARFIDKHAFISTELYLL